MALDIDKLNAFVGRFVGDLGAAVHTGMVVIGERLGVDRPLSGRLRGTARGVGAPGGIRNQASVLYGLPSRCSRSRSSLVRCSSFSPSVRRAKTFLCARVIASAQSRSITATGGSTIRRFRSSPTTA